MAKLLLYLPIMSYTAERFVESLNTIPEDEDLELLMNTPGGSVFAGWSIIGPLNERSGKNTAKVYGNASSMGFFMLLFMDHVEALDVSTFMIHRASGYVSSDEDKKFLNDINKTLRAKLEKKIDAKVFEEVTGKTFKQIFESEERIDVHLTAKQALKIGLINKIQRLESKELKAYTDKFAALAEFDEQGSESEIRGSIEQQEQTEQNNNQKNKSMTAAEFKAAHPEQYQAIFNAGVTQERDRVEAFLQFIEVDATAVKKEIEEGRDLSQKFTGEMTMRSISEAQLNAQREETPGEQTTETNEPKVTKVTAEQEAEIKAAEKEIMTGAGLTMED